MKVSLFRHAKDITPCAQLPVRTVLESIRNPKPAVAKLIADIRAAPDKATRRKLKEELPAVSFGAELSTRDRDKTEAEKVVAESGYICLDLDHLPDVDATKESLKGAPFIYAMFISPSGDGLKVLVPIVGGFHAHWQALADHMMSAHGLEVDSSRSDLVGLCFASHDPELWIAEGDVAPFAATTGPRKNQTNIPATGGDVLPDYLDARKVEEVLNVLNADMGYNQWLDVGMGIHCQLGGAGLAVFDSWSSRGSKYQGSNEVANKWQSFGGSGITFKSVLKMAFEAGYQMPRSVVEKSKPVSVDGERVEAPFRTLSDIVAKIKAGPPPCFLDGAIRQNDVGVMHSRGGVGKTTTALKVAECCIKGLPLGDIQVRHGSVLIICPDDADGTERKVAVIGQGTRGDILVMTDQGANRFPKDHERLDAIILQANARPGAVPIVLVIIDTLDATSVRVSTGWKATDDAAQEYLDGLKPIAKARDCAALVLHHSTKDGEDMRGSDTIRNASDFTMALKCVGERVVLTVVKNRAGPSNQVLCTFDMEQVDTAYGKALSLTAMSGKAAAGVRAELLSIEHEDDMLAAARERMKAGIRPNARSLAKAINKSLGAVSRLAAGLRARGLMGQNNFVPTTLESVPDDEKNTCLGQTLGQPVPSLSQRSKNVGQTVKAERPSGTGTNNQPHSVPVSLLSLRGTLGTEAGRDVGFDVVVDDEDKFLNTLVDGEVVV